MDHEHQYLSLVNGQLVFFQNRLKSEHRYVFDQVGKRNAAKNLHEGISLYISHESVEGPGNAYEGNNADGASLEGLISVTIVGSESDDEAVEAEEDGAEDGVGFITHDCIDDKEKFIYIDEEFDIED